MHRSIFELVNATAERDAAKEALDVAKKAHLDAVANKEDKNAYLITRPLAKAAADKKKQLDAARQDKFKLFCEEIFAFLLTASGHVEGRPSSSSFATSNPNDELSIESKHAIKQFLVDEGKEKVREHRYYVDNNLAHLDKKLADAVTAAAEKNNRGTTKEFNERWLAVNRKIDEAVREFIAGARDGGGSTDFDVTGVRPPFTLLTLCSSLRTVHRPHQSAGGLEERPNSQSEQASRTDQGQGAARACTLVSRPSELSHSPP